MWIRREDYGAIRRFVPDEPQLPNTFEQWEQAANKQATELQARGVAMR